MYIYINSFLLKLNLELLQKEKVWEIPHLPFVLLQNVSISKLSDFDNVFVVTKQ